MLTPRLGQFPTGGKPAKPAQRGFRFLCIGLSEPYLIPIIQISPVVSTGVKQQKPERNYHSNALEDAAVARATHDPGRLIHNRISCHRNSA